MRSVLVGVVYRDRAKITARIDTRINSCTSSSEVLAADIDEEKVVEEATIGLPRMKEFLLQIVDEVVVWYMKRIAEEMLLDRRNCS